MMQPEYDIDRLFEEAQTRWLKPAEVYWILQNHEQYGCSPNLSNKPPSGSWFFFNKKVLRNFRKDGHDWRKKKNSNVVLEAHERLKVGNNSQAISCYYAHGQYKPNFQRRIYWIVDPKYEHIVLVHYRDINIGKPSGGPVPDVSTNSSTFGPYPNPSSTSMICASSEPHQNVPSPVTVEVSSQMVTNGDGQDTLNEFTPSDFDNYDISFDDPVDFKFLEQICFGDNVFPDMDDNRNVIGLSEIGNGISEQDQYAPGTMGQGYAGGQDQSGNAMLPKKGSGYNGKHEDSGSLFWNVLESCESSLHSNPKERTPSNKKEVLSEGWQSSVWPNYNLDQSMSSALPPQECDNFKIPRHTSVIESPETSTEYNKMLFDQGQMRMKLEPNLSSSAAETRRFTIRQISPEWGYACEKTKVIIVGSFLCPSEATWKCMFGDTVVPIQIIQEGVLLCEAPPNLPGKVTLRVISGRGNSYSYTREFEYRDQTKSCSHCNSVQIESTKLPKSSEEVVLLVRFVQMLLSDSSLEKGDSKDSGNNIPEQLEAQDDSWSNVIESLLDGSGTSSNTVDWLLQKLLKDKLQQWLSRPKMEHSQTNCLLSKKEKGIIHMVSGLGFEWALKPLLSHGISIDFRDINGWTALHWAAYFGRESMVAALIASGASAGALTDPNSNDPTGKTPALIAASNGYKGLAGYLSEVALTTHLAALTLDKSELAKGSAEVQADMAVNSIPTEIFSTNQDQLFLKDTLAAVRNSAQAAARIQAAFRAHSFRKRQEKEAIDTACMAEFGISSFDIRGLSRLGSVNHSDYNTSALSIQKKYRGWKGRKEFLALRQKVVKIQAHVRGYQVRKHYKIITWAVGILDKAVLRWRRKGVGLRGYRPELESTEESEDEDIIRPFRRDKVDPAIQKALSRVLSMAHSSDARQQYGRLLERYRIAKAEIGHKGEASSSTPVGESSDMDEDDIFSQLTDIL